MKGSKAFLVPVLLGFTLSTAAPIIAIFSLAGFNWNLVSAPKWVGLDNFNFGLDLGPTIWIAFLTLLFQLVAGSTLGYFLANWSRSSSNLAAIYLLPWLTAPIALGVIWKWLLAPTGGLISAAVGYRLDLLTNPTLAPLAIAFVAAWSGAGFTALVFASGLRTVRANTVDAAKLDGAGKLATLWQVQLPQMRRIIFFIVLSITLQSMAIYDLVLILTGGNQGTNVASINIVNAALKTFEVGRASADSIIFTLFELLIIAIEYLIYHWLTRRFDE